MRTKAKILSILFTVLLLVFSAISFAIENDSVELGFSDESLTAVEKDSSQSLSYNGSITLDKDSYAFKGKAIKPKVVVYYDGKKIKKNKDYKLEFANNTAIGYGSVTAIGVGKYTGRISLEFPIVPQPVKIKKIVKFESGFEAQWKVAKDADGYEIEYSLNSDFSDFEVTKIEGNANNVFKKIYLESLKRYYIRLRSYKIVSDEPFYSSWSKTSKFVVGKYDLIRGTYMVVDLASGSTSHKYPVSYLESMPPEGWPEEYKTTKMVFRLVSAGTFMMGSPEDEFGHCSPEILHPVTLTRPFYVGVFEVTQKQFKLITGEDPSEYKGDARPVENISWGSIRGRKGWYWPENDDVDEESFLGKLRSRTGLKFDLPTEAQWEYACRAGTTTGLNNGSNITNYYDGTLNLLARWYWNGGSDLDENNDYMAHAVVGSYLPNAWGLYDMHGNVQEWCLDYQEEYSSGPVTDPKVGNRYDDFRVVRGGHWYIYNAHWLRSSYRNSIFLRGGDTGFRLVLVL